MKKKLLLKTMLLLCALIVGSSNVWADTETLVFNTDAGLSALGITKPSAGNGTNLGSTVYSQGNVSLSATDGGAATRVWNKSGSTELRVYNNGGSIIISISSGYSISSIVFTGTTSFTAIDGWTASTKTWTGEATSVTFSASSACNINTIAVTYSSTDSRTPIATIGDLTPMEIPFNGSGNFTLGVTPATDAYSVSYESSDDDALYINGDEYLAGTTKGNVTVTATVTPTDVVTYKPVSKEFTVNIYNPDAGDGTEARPFSVAEAIDFIEAESYTSNTNYYVKGKVSQKNNSLSSGKLTYYISDDGTTTGQLQVYSGKYLENENFTNVDQIALNDDVIVVGPLLYFNNSTPEINTGNYIYSLNGKKLAGISYATTAYNSLPAAAFETPTLTNPNNVTVTYSSDNTDVATVDASTGNVTIGNAEGTATITATFDGNDSFLAATASYTITTARADANISFSETSLTLTQGDEFTAPTFNNPNNLTGIVFTSTYDAVATISDAGVISLGNSTGTAIIKATYAQSVQYNAGEATCTITVNPAGVTPEPSAGGYYEKVTSTTSLEDGDYLIVNEVSNIAMSNAVDQANNYISITIAANQIEISSETATAEFAITKSNDVYYIKGKNNNYIGRGPNSNGLDTSASPLDNTITFDGGKAIIKGAGGAKLQVNGGTRFRYYTSNQSPVYLYKKVAGQSPSSIDVYVSAAGFATYASNFDLNYEGSGLVAYKAVEDNGDIKFEEVTKVPAGAGVLLRASDGGGQNYAVSTTTSSETEDMEGNKFVRGTGAAVASNDGEGNYNYILNVVNNEIGFYRAAGNTVATNRAYIHTTINPTSGAIQFNFDEATGIRSVDNGQLTMDNEIYNLNGQRVAQPTKGLYILNGKKVIIK